MAQRRKSNGNWWIALFILLVVVSGYGLYQSGHLKNPFSVLGLRGFSDAGGTFVPRGGDAGNRAEPPRAGGGDVDRGGQDGFVLSQLGDVLFNLWFICATTAVVIMVQKGVGFLISKLYRRRSMLPAQP